MYKAINYDTGFEPYGPEHNNRKIFEEDAVRREMAVIATELGCTHVRITGADPERIALAARHAITAGLKVWFSPFPCNLSTAELLPYFVACALKAEEIRLLSADTTLVLGCELSIFNNGFLPGYHLIERTQAFAEFGRWKANMTTLLNDFFRLTLPEVRQNFQGTITYAAGEWEAIDWQVFDIVSVDLYRAKHNQAYYEQQLAAYLAYQKPVAITEFGCCPVQGAAELGGNATFTLLSFQDGGLVVNEGWIYSEEEQVNYLKELYSLFTTSGVAFAFWFTFADYGKPYSSDVRHNLDMASYVIVQTYPDLSWKPRKAFWEMSRL